MLSVIDVDDVEVIYLRVLRPGGRPA